MLTVDGAEDVSRSYGSSRNGFRTLSLAVFSDLSQGRVRLAAMIVTLCFVWLAACYRAEEFIILKRWPQAW